MKNGKYEAALMTLIPSNPKEWQGSHIELLTATNTIDNLTDTIARDAAAMGKKFTSFSEEMLTRGDGWSPMGYSTLRDLEVNIAKLEVHKTYLINLLRAFLGKDGVKAFRDALSRENPEAV